MSISEPKITRVAIADIEATHNRLRPVSDAGVDSLVTSIEQMGVMKDPIHLRRKGRGDQAQLILMALGHRLAAAKRLGWDTIPARVWADVSDDFADLMEIEDNLSGSDLSNLELAVFLAKRKVVYERMYPQARNGAHGGRGGKKNETDIMPFSKSVAQKRDLSARHIRRFLSIGNRLDGAQIKALEGLASPPSLKELMALAKISDPAERQAVFATLGDGCDRVSDAIAAQTPKPAPISHDDASYMKLIDAWERASRGARQRFLSDYGGAIVALIEQQKAGG